MKKVIIITVIVLAVGGAGYWVYKKFRKPKVKAISIDWERGLAEVYINGKQQQLPPLMSIAIGNGYSVGFSQSFYRGTQKMDNTSLVLTKNGVVYETIAQRS